MLSRRALLQAAAAAALLASTPTGPSQADEVPGLKLEGGGRSLLLTPQDIAEATAQEDGYGGWQLNVRLEPHAAAELKAITEESIGLPLAITFRGEVVSEPVVREVIAGGSFKVSGLDRVTAARIAAFAKGL